MHYREANIQISIKSIVMYFIVSSFLGFEMAVQVSPSIMTSQLMNEYGIGAFGLGLIASVYYYTYTLMQIPAGLLFDRFNIRFVVIIPLLICSLGTFLFSFSHSLEAAALARLFMGAGSAFAFIAVLVVSSEIFEKKYFAFLSGVTQMIAAFGAMGGQYPLGELVQHYGWRHTMELISITGVIISVLIWFFVRYEKDYIYHSKSNFSSIIKSLKLIFARSQTWYVALYACFLWAPMACFASLWGVPFLEKNYLFSSSKAALLTSMLWLGIAIASPLLGIFSDSIKSRKIPLLLSALLGLFCLAILLFASSLSETEVGILLFGMGFACSGQALSFAVIRDINDQSNIAAAIGFNNMAVVIAGAIFQPFVGKFIELHAQWSGTKQILQPADYKFGLYILLICYLGGAISSAFFIKETLKKEVN